MNVSKWIAGALVGVIAASFALDVEAQRRLGGGKNLGKQSPQVQQRQATPPQQQTPPAQQAAPGQQPGTAAAPAAATGAAAAGTAARASSPWRGALMGLAAGLGIAALASWLGFGEGLAMFMMMLLIGLLLFIAVGFVLRRMRGAQPAYQGAGQGGGMGGYQAPAPEPQRPQPLQRAAVDGGNGIRPGSAMDEFLRGGAVNPAQPWGVPAGFDTDGFLANARSYFGKLQAAWDSGSLEQLQDFTSNEMFIALTHELRARNGAAGGATRTEVVSLEATLLGIDSSASEHVASVRFTGTLRVDGDIEQVDEVWNLVKPADGRHGWLLAGIQQIS